MSRSNVYLVSARHNDDMNGYDNTGYTMNEVKVTNSATSGVDLEESKKPMPDKPYRGMGKEELLYFSSQPFWRRLRTIVIAIVLIAWLALIITVVALVLAYPKCRDPESRSWWQSSAVYRVYVPSFKDSDGDGIGDLKGVESGLDYIKDRGFSIVSLSPFYRGDATETNTTLQEFKAGDDMAIIDHKAVGEKYGNITTFDNLVAKAHEKGMYVVIDFIPNLTSKKHSWFTSSSASGANAMSSYYVWGGSGTSVPNNWQKVYNESAWKDDVTNRTEWYLQQFGPDTANLNLRSNRVREELETILNFWLDHGVDGINVLNTAYLYQDYDMRDDSAPQDMDRSSKQPEVYGLLEEWRILLRQHNKSTTEKVLMADIDGGLDATRVYSSCARSGVQMPLNRKSFSLGRSCGGHCIAEYVDSWMGSVPEGKWPNWVLGDENSDRLASRFNQSFVDALAILTYLLPGTPVMYNGDEMGTINTGDPVDPWSRGQPKRGIVPWSDGNFCTNNCTTWTNTSHHISSDLGSLLKDLVALREEPSFKVGDYAKALRGNKIFSFVREFDGESGYLVALNFGATKVTADFVGSHDTIPSEAVVALAHGAPYEVEDDAVLSSLEIDGYGGLVVSWDYVAKEL